MPLTRCWSPLVLYLTLRWGRTRSPGTLRLLALVYGLSLAHHRTMALFAPALLAYVWVLEKGALWRDGRRLLGLGALVLAPLLLYLYLPWGEARGLPPGTWHPRTAREWYDYLFDTGRTGLVYVDPNDLGEMLLFYLRTLLRDFTWVGVLLGVGGLVAMFRRRWLDAAFLLFNYCDAGLSRRQPPRAPPLGLLYPLLCHFCPVGGRGPVRPLAGLAALCQVHRGAQRVHRETRRGKGEKTR